MPDNTRAVGYSLTYDLRDVFAEFDPAPIQKIRKILRTAPHPHFVEALEQLRQKFTPHVDREKCPWIIHQKLGTKYEKICQKIKNNKKKPMTY